MQQKKQTQAQLTTQAMQLAKQQVCMVLELTEDDYAEMQYHSGISFLSYKCQWEVCEQRVAASKIFWNFWKLNWQMRDEQFLQQYQVMQVCPTQGLVIKNWGNKSQYLLIHNPHVLSSTVDEYGAMFHKAWVQILGIINEDEIKNANLC